MYNINSPNDISFRKCTKKITKEIFFLKLLGGGGGGKSNIDFRTLQYAEDIILLIKDEESLKFALKDISNFSKHAGSRLNLEITEIIGLGKYKL